MIINQKCQKNVNFDTFLPVLIIINRITLKTDKIDFSLYGSVYFPNIYRIFAYKADFLYFKRNLNKFNG